MTLAGRLPAAMLAVPLLLPACQGSSDGASNSGSGRSAPSCPGGTYQCGYGCLTLSAKCCTSQTDQSTWGEGTSECPSAQLSSCNSNPGGTCTGTVSGMSASPMPASAYCCSTNSTVGSLDCTDGTVVCNLMCVAVGSKCCSLTNPSDCGNVGGAVQTGGGSGSSSGGAGNSYYYANYNCGQQSQCAADFNGNYTGSAGPFCSVTSCNSWLATYFPGGTCTTSPQYTITNAPPAGTCQ